MRRDTRVTREQDMLTCGNGARFYFLATASPHPSSAALPTPSDCHWQAKIARRKHDFLPSFGAFSRARSRALKRTREKSSFRDAPTTEKCQSSPLLPDTVPTLPHAATYTPRDSPEMNGLHFSRFARCWTFFKKIILRAGRTTAPR